MQPAHSEVAGAKPPLFVGAIHGLRGFAVLVVVFVHICGNAAWWPQHHVPFSLIQGGYVALDALFFTTGFVLFLPVALKGTLGDLRALAVRRLTRLVPAYYVCLLVILVAYPLITNEAVRAAAHNGVSDYLWHVVFLQREVLQGNTGFGVNGPLWVLSIDVTFYLLLPLIARPYLRHPLVGLAIALGISLVWRLLFFETLDAQALAAGQLDIGIQFPLFTADLGAGMTAAWLFVRLRDLDTVRIPRKWATAVAGAAFAALVFLTYLSGADLPFKLALFQGPTAVALAVPLVLLVFLIAITRSYSWAEWPLSNRASYWMGEICYSAYLYHAVVIAFALYTVGVVPAGNPRALLELSAVVLPLTLVIALISYRFIEVPARTWGRRVARGFSEGAPRPSPAPVAGESPQRAAAG